MPVVAASHNRAALRVLALGGVISVVTMPLMAMWFLLAGGVLVVGGLIPAVTGRRSEVGMPTFVGLGLLVGPAIYISLAVLQ
jgi:hypothetical protein